MARLVEILAKEMDVWPNGAVYAVQDGDARKTIKFGKKESGLGIQALGHHLAVWQCPNWNFTTKHDFDHSELADDFKESVVYMAQWQAERDRQKGGEWKRHRGGKCPVKAGTKVSTRHRDGEVVDVHFQTHQYGTHEAVMDCVWKHDGSKDDIMAYKVISQPQAEEVAVKDTISTFKAFEPTGQWHQIDGPIKWRDTVNELDAYIEEFTREREALINRLAEEGFSLIPAMTAVMVAADVDMGDYLNWNHGDILRCVHTEDTCAELTVGREYTATRVNGELGVIDDAGDHMCYCIENANLVFIRRP